MIARRRLLAAPLLAAPAARAQRGPFRIGWLTAQREASLATFVPALRGGLAEHGLVEGRNLRIEFRFGDSDAARVPALAAELARLPVSVLIVQGAATQIAAGLGLPIPLVVVISGDPVEAGLATSLARPPANLTGVTFLAPELNGKRVELLRDLVPGLSRIGIIANPDHPGEVLERSQVATTARALGVEARFHRTATQAELDAALREIAVDPPQALSVLADGFALQHRARIAEFALAHRLPLVAGWRSFAEAGALCALGPRLDQSYRRLAYFVDRILRGASPSELPIERPTEFETILNQRTADAIGLELPPTVLARADAILE